MGPATCLLITSVHETDARRLAAELRGLGWLSCAAAGCGSLVPEVVRLAPDAVIAYSPERLDAALVAPLAALRDAVPRPVLLVGPALRRGDITAMLDAGVDEWRALPGSADDWALWLALAAARHRREMAQRAAADDALARLDERKWIDRAKGVLMRAQQVDEDRAYGLLREASMHANLRVGEVSRGVIEAARAAEAVNRAGQLRMLSQRIVKALALRAAAVDAAGADAMVADSRERLRANLDLLDAAVGDAVPQPLAGARAAAAGLDALLGGEAGLAEVDGGAETLLVAADTLTAGIEAALGRGGLRVVNVCGRQRMLSQRLAKQAVLMLRPPADARSWSAPTLAEARTAFEAGLAELDATPLSTDAIRAELAAARGQWTRLLDAAARGALPALAHESEALLASFERLTSLYERSMQLLLG